MKPAAAIAIGVVLLLGAACAGAGSGAEPSSPPADEGLPAAIEEVMDRMAKLRGLEPVPALKAELIGRADLPDLLESLITDEDRDLADRLTTLYRLLGHFSPDQDYLGVYQSFGADSILGLYSPLHDTLWVVSEEEQAAFDALSGEEERTLAHELVHALQDYHYDLDATYERIVDDPDRSMAWTVVVEGDASWFENAYHDEYLWRPAAGRVFALGTLPETSDVPLTFIRELLFPYTAGEEWVGDVLDAHGRDYLDGLLAEPPPGTICVLHLERCPAGYQPADVVLPDIAAALGGSWQLQWAATLGEFQLGNFLDLELPLAEGSAAADGWAGDTFATYADGDGTLLVALLEFVSEQEAAEFVHALDALVDGAGGSPGQAAYVTRVADGREFAVATPSPTSVFLAIANDVGPAARAWEILAGG